MVLFTKYNIKKYNITDKPKRKLLTTVFEPHFTLFIHGHKIRIFCLMSFSVREGMEVGVRSSIYDPIGQVGWLHWVSRKIVDERWSPNSRVLVFTGPMENRGESALDTRYSVPDSLADSIRISLAWRKYLFILVP
jgi:hypothetical protein